MNSKSKYTVIFVGSTENSTESVRVRVRVRPNPTPPQVGWSGSSPRILAARLSIRFFRSAVRRPFALVGPVLALGRFLQLLLLLLLLLAFIC